MKTIIAGGRDYKLTHYDIAVLDALHGRGRGLTEVVSGMATGADTGGAMWAIERGIPVHEKPAKWDDISAPDAVIRIRRDGTKYNMKAGFDRNQEMADYADACILFPGGSGTEDMFRRAQKAGLRIIDLREPAK